MAPLCNVTALLWSKNYYIISMCWGSYNKHLIAGVGYVHEQHAVSMKVICNE